MYVILLYVSMLLPPLTSAGNCFQKHRVCNVKDALSGICRHNGGIYQHFVIHSKQELLQNCCTLEGCDQHYLCNFCKNPCCQIAIDFLPAV